MDSCWGKGILVILAIMFFPITITVFILKSDMEIKGKLIATVILWGGLIIFSNFMPEKEPEVTRDKPAVVSDSTTENSSPSANKTKADNDAVYDIASDRILRENHPTLFDAAATAREFWAGDLADDAVVIRDSDHADQDYPNAYLIIDCYKEENGSIESSEQITAIHIPNYNCKDIPRFVMKDAIEVTRSYLPVSALTEKYELRDSAYENLWADDYVWDGSTRKPQIQYDYYTNYELTEESADDPAWISIHMYTDRYGIVVDADILLKQHQPKGEIAAWGYDYIENNSTYELGITGNELYVDKELGIDYPRPSGTPALSTGSKGGHVGWLQNALIKAMNAGLKTSCVFDSDTDSAVREFQSRCGLGVDGSVGPKTISLLVDIVSGNKTMPEKIIVTDPPRVIVDPEPEPEKPVSVYTPPTKQSSTVQYVLNTSTMKIHTTTCRDLAKMDPENRMDYTGSIDDLIAQGYTACGHCHPH